MVSITFMAIEWTLIQDTIYETNKMFVWTQKSSYHFFEKSRTWTCVRRALNFELNFCHQQSLWRIGFVTKIHSLFSDALWNAFRILSKAQKTLFMSLKLFSGCNETPISTSPTYLVQIKKIIIFAYNGKSSFNTTEKFK